MNSIVSKSDCLIGLKEAVENFKHIFEKNRDPFWEQAVKECILEYDLVNYPCLKAGACSYRCNRIRGY